MDKVMSQQDQAGAPQNNGKAKGRKPKGGASLQELSKKNAHLEERLQEMQALLQAKDQEILGLKGELYDHYQRAVLIQHGQIQQLQAKVQELTGEDQAG